MKKGIYLALGVMLAVALIGIIILIVNMESTSVLNSITPTEAVREAYADGASIQKVEHVQALSFDGYMRCYATVYIPSAKEFQVTVKSNNSVYEKLGTTASAGYDFMLYDVKTEREYRDYTEERASEGRYGYYRLVFSDVDFDVDTEIELIMFPKGNEEKYSFFKLHEAGKELSEYELSKEEIASLSD